MEVGAQGVGSEMICICICICTIPVDRSFISFLKLSGHVESLILKFSLLL